MTATPFQRALRNSLVLSLIVAGLVMYQEGSAVNSLLTGAFTLAVTFPALWLSFRYTQRLVDKYAVSEEKENLKKPE